MTPSCSCFSKFYFVSLPFLFVFPRSSFKREHTMMRNDDLLYKKSFMSSLHLPSNSRFFSILNCSSVLHLHLARSSSCSCCLFTSSLRFSLHFASVRQALAVLSDVGSFILPFSFSLPFCVPMRFFVDVFYFTDIRLLCSLACHAPPFPSFPIALTTFLFMFDPRSLNNAQINSVPAPLIFRISLDSHSLFIPIFIIRPYI